MPLPPITIRVYARRNRHLKELGFENYAAYLVSDLWASVRKRALQKHKDRCYACDKPATQVHHGKYEPEDLLGKSLKNLYAVCRDCHERCEVFHGSKLPPGAATARLKAWRKERLAKPPADRSVERAGTMTEQELDKFRTKKGGWGRSTFKALGLPPRPPKGWRKRLLGKLPPLDAASPDAVP